MRLTIGLTALLLAIPLAGCSDDAVDASCDVDGLTHEAEHMVGEAGLTVSATEELSCDGDWATVLVGVTDDLGQESTERFVFARVDEVGWVMKSAADACAGDGAGFLPAGLRDQACSG